MWSHTTQLRGFSALLHDLDQIRDGRLASLHRLRQAETEAVDMATSIREGGQRTVKAISALTEQLGDMAKRMEADARAMEINRRAEGREQLAAFNQQVLDSIRGGLISGEEGNKLDQFIHKMAMRLEP